VQWKISTVGWIGRTCGHVRVYQIPGSAESGFCEVLGGVNLSHSVLVLYAGSSRT
jgi:hypothetical protein